MKKILTALAFALCFGLPARAQVFIINENMFQGRMSEIKTTVLDSLTNEPVSFASVYVIPSKDTTITNFTLTDAKGEAKLDEVPYGSYVFHVEMLGYKPVIKERYFREREVDMGTIRMQVDEQFLQTAVVTDVGNPIVIKKDTVEFNASSFRVGANAMLKDLLQRMPGMEITEDGKVKFNGEEIDKLTVGGRTFFFNDQSTALNNLPASVVDKIRVIDRESEQTRASGIQDGQREKVLDVALKKEYEKGWFGNAALKGGTTLGNKDDDNPLRDDRGLLWSANALVSAYGEKDQVTVIANGQNISDSSMIVVFRDYEDGNRTSSLGQGLSEAAQLGINANTSRIKDVETTVSTNYKYSDTDSGTKSSRTTWQDDGNLQSSTEEAGKQYATSLNADVEFKKEKGNVWFHVNPSFRYGNTNGFAGGKSETLREGTFVNSSENSSHRLSTSRNADFDADVIFRDLWGKKNRSIRFDIDGSYGVSSGESSEQSVLKTGTGTNSRSLQYQSDGYSRGFSGDVRYTEPIGEKWTFSAVADYTLSQRSNVRDAFEGGTPNAYYSSESRTDYFRQQYDLTAQYTLGEQSWITLGARAMGTLNEVFSKSYGVEQTTGKDEWLWNVTPTMRLQHKKDNDRFNFSVSGYANRPGADRLLPVLNIADPSRLSLGNIYLKPYTMTYFSGNWNRNNKEKFSTLMVFLTGQVNTNPISYATWYDSDGILYSIPVNATKPGIASSLYLDYTTPLDAKKNWSLTLEAYLTYNSSVSYQSKTTLAGLDKTTFDYSNFMSGFWGNSSGDRFYGGQSGFQESKTRSIGPYAGFSLKYNQDRYWFTIGADADGLISRYSLDPSINMNTLDTRIQARGSYTTKHEFELGSDLSYVFYTGYAEGYGQPEWQWNADVTKNVGAFTLSLTLHDILDQTRTLTHSVTANYQEDTYRLVMGRYILFGVKWNFGKMNASHSQRASRAAWNMVF